MKDITHLLDIVEKACVRQPLFHFYSFLRILTHMCIKIKLYTCAFRCVKVRSRCARNQNRPYGSSGRKGGLLCKSPRTQAAGAARLDGFTVRAGAQCPRSGRLCVEFAIIAPPDDMRRGAHAFPPAAPPRRGCRPLRSRRAIRSRGQRRGRCRGAHRRSSGSA